jgi:hypothetical protein
MPPSDPSQDFHPAPKCVEDDHEVALRKTLPEELGVTEELGEAGEVFGLRPR